MASKYEVVPFDQPAGQSGYEVVPFEQSRSMPDDQPLSRPSGLRRAVASTPTPTPKPAPTQPKRGLFNTVDGLVSAAYFAGENIGRAARDLIFEKDNDPRSMGLAAPPPLTREEAQAGTQWWSQRQQNPPAPGLPERIEADRLNRADPPPRRAIAQRPMGLDAANAGELRGELVEPRQAVERPQAPARNFVRNPDGSYSSPADVPVTAQIPVKTAGQPAYEGPGGTDIGAGLMGAAMGLASWLPGSPAIAPIENAHNKDWVDRTFSDVAPSIGRGLGAVALAAPLGPAGVAVAGGLTEANEIGREKAIREGKAVVDYGETLDAIANDPIKIARVAAGAAFNGLASALGRTFAKQSAKQVAAGIERAFAEQAPAILKQTENAALRKEIMKNIAVNAPTAAAQTALALVDQGIDPTSEEGVWAIAKGMLMSSAMEAGGAALGARDVRQQGMLQAAKTIGDRTGDYGPFAPPRTAEPPPIPAEARRAAEPPPIPQGAVARPAQAPEPSRVIPLVEPEAPVNSDAPAPPLDPQSYPPIFSPEFEARLKERRAVRRPVDLQTGRELGPETTQPIPDTSQRGLNAAPETTLKEEANGQVNQEAVPQADAQGDADGQGRQEGLLSPETAAGAAAEVPANAPAPPHDLATLPRAELVKLATERGIKSAGLKKDAALIKGIEASYKVKSGKSADPNATSGFNNLNGQPARRIMRDGGLSAEAAEELRHLGAFEGMREGDIKRLAPSLYGKAPGPVGIDEIGSMLSQTPELGVQIGDTFGRPDRNTIIEWLNENLFANVQTGKHAIKADRSAMEALERDAVINEARKELAEAAASKRPMSHAEFTQLAAEAKGAPETPKKPIVAGDYRDGQELWIEGDKFIKDTDHDNESVVLRDDVVIRAGLDEEVMVDRYTELGPKVESDAGFDPGAFDESPKPPAGMLFPAIENTPAKPADINDVFRNDPVRPEPRDPGTQQASLFKPEANQGVGGDSVVSREQRAKIGASDAPENVPDMLAGGGRAPSGGGVGSPVAMLGAGPSAPGTGSRIDAAPLPGGTPRRFEEMLKDLGKIVKRKIVKAKTGRFGGVYYPGSARVTVKFHNDLSTAMHESAHAMDDAFGIVKDWNRPRVRSPYDAELEPFWTNGGSATQSGPRAKLSYKRGEGVAEWLRAWIINPDAAESAAPQFAQFFRSKVPANVLNDLRAWGDEVRRWSGMPGNERTLANVRTEEPGAVQRLKENLINETNLPLHIGAWDKVVSALSDDLHPVMKGIRAAKGLRGILKDDLAPSKDPEGLIRRIGGIEDKIYTAVEQGLPVWNSTQRATTGFFDWMWGSLDQTSPKALKEEIGQVSSLLINERIIEKARLIQEDADVRIQDLNNAMPANPTPDELAALARQSARIQQQAKIQMDRMTGTGGGLVSDTLQAQQALNEFMQMPASKRDRLRAAADRYRQWGDSLLRYMVDGGRLSEEAYLDIKAKNLDYVSFKRIIDDLAIPGGVAGSGKKIGSVAQPIKQFKGMSGRTIENVYVSMLDQTRTVIKETDRNAALRAFTDLLNAPRGMHEGPALNLAAIGAKGKTGDKNSIQVTRDGKAETWMFQDDVYRALKKWGETEDSNIVWKILQIPAKLTRGGVVYEPGFALRNIIRDAANRGVISETGSKPWDIFHRIDADDLARYRATGGGNSGYYMSDRVSYHKELARRIRELGGEKTTILSLPGKMLNGYERLIGSSEIVGRMAEFRSAEKYAKEKLGYNDYETALYASGKARDLLDFQIAGSAIRRINKYIPFTNPAIRGPLRAWQGMQRNPANFVARWSLYVLAPTILTYLWNAHDDQTMEEYRQLPAWRRDQFYNFRIGNNWLTIPKPFELGVMGAAVERAIDRINGNDKAFEGYNGTVANSLLPVDEGTLAGPFKAIIESAANYNFFLDRPIVPAWETELDVERRGGKDSASRLGGILQDMIGLDARKADHLIQSQLGGLGRMALRASDFARDGKASTVPDIAKQASGVIKPVGIGGTRDVTQAFKLAGKAGKQGDKGMKRLGLKLKNYRKIEDEKDKRSAEHEIYNEAARQRQRMEGEIKKPFVKKQKRSKPVWR
jgi:hypothetical protein